MKKCAVYSGSFNPIHKGHEKIIDIISNEFDEVRVIVTPKNPLKETVSKESAIERFNLVKKVIDSKQYKNVIVDDIELNMEGPNYTYKTLKKLSDKYKDTLFILVVGGDCLEHFDEWKNWKEILSEFGVAYLHRDGYDEKKYIERLSKIENNKLRYWLLKKIDGEIPKISSTEIREKLK